MARVRRARPAAESSVAIRDGVAHITPPACVEAAARPKARAASCTHTPRMRGGGSLGETASKGQWSLRWSGAMCRHG